MYFVVSWDIPDASWDQRNENMKACFSHYEWIKPLSTFYLVKCSSAQDYSAILSQMQTLASNGKGVWFVSAIIYSSSGWDGWLNKEDWPKIREITG